MCRPGRVLTAPCADRCVCKSELVKPAVYSLRGLRGTVVRVRVRACVRARLLGQRSDLGKRDRAPSSLQDDYVQRLPFLHPRTRRYLDFERDRRHARAREGEACMERKRAIGFAAVSVRE
jgi:hypothetical protein